jgi:hypothetical protein
LLLDAGWMFVIPNGQSWSRDTGQFDHIPIELADRSMTVSEGFAVSQNGAYVRAKHSPNINRLRRASFASSEDCPNQRDVS